MLNHELILYDGDRVYPAYLSHDDRMSFVKRFGEKREYMWCGCRDDARLYYRFSSDGRIYPERRDYAHARGCIFEQADRKERAFIQDGENGETRVFLSFDPKDFPAPAEDKDDEGGMGKTAPPRIGDGLNYYPLENFVKQLNTDTFNERMAVGRSVLSADYFLSSIFGRLKNIVIDGCRKPLRDFRLDGDRWQFFYTQFEGYGIKEKPDGRNSCSLTVKDPGTGKEYSWFIYEHTLNVAVRRFVSHYGCTPMEVPDGTKVIMSGFRYLRSRKGSRDTYKVVGRLCFFIVNANGLIGRSMHEKDSLDSVCSVLRYDRTLRFFLCDVGEDAWGYFEKKGDAAKYVIGFPGTGCPGKLLINDFSRKSVSVEEIKKFLQG